MSLNNLKYQDIILLLKNGKKLPFAIENYPSRGQTAVQELYQTEKGKFFLKRVSERNHEECQIDVKSGTLAEREYWAFCLAREICLAVPPLWLIDEVTTVQVWFDYPDGKTFKKSTGKMDLQAANIFDCSVFDWVTGQIDRHDANYLYNYIVRQIVPVDSAHGFLKYEGALPDYLHLFEVGQAGLLDRRIRSTIKTKLDEISDDEMRRLVPLRNGVELDALMIRKKRILKTHSIKKLLDLYRSR